MRYFLAAIQFFAIDSLLPKHFGTHRLPDQVAHAHKDWTKDQKHEDRLGRVEQRKYSNQTGQAAQAIKKQGQHIPTSLHAEIKSFLGSLLLDHFFHQKPLHRDQVCVILWKLILQMNKHSEMHELDLKFSHLVLMLH